MKNLPDKMTKQETIQVLQSIEDRATDFPYMTACDWVAIAAAKRHLQEEPVSVWHNASEKYPLTEKEIIVLRDNKIYYGKYIGGRHEYVRAELQLRDDMAQTYATIDCLTKKDKWIYVEDLQTLANSAKTCKNEQNHVDKVEPKFHEGEWITNGDYTWKIVEVKPLDYILQSQEGNIVDDTISHVDEQFHSFTIKDAKDGDVLVSESNCGLGTWYCIFKSLDDDESMTVYCYLARDGRFETKKELCFDKDPYNTKPATKEQRDQLEKAMANAGYTFDFDKKELKKIEGTTAWSEEDESHIRYLIECLEHCKKGVALTMTTSTSQEYINWLKHLKDRYTWKPSEEQLRELRCVISGCSFETPILVELEEQLKKL